MSKMKRQTKLVREGDFVAEVEVQFISDDHGWSPYLSVEDANKLDDVREALRAGNIDSARNFAKVYSLTLVGG
jgi:hypothetical protein